MDIPKFKLKIWFLLVLIMIIATFRFVFLDAGKSINSKQANLPSQEKISLETELSNEGESTKESETNNEFPGNKKNYLIGENVNFIFNSESKEETSQTKQFSGKNYTSTNMP